VTTDPDPSADSESSKPASAEAPADEVKEASELARREAPVGEREIRRYQAAVSVGAQALGWANLEKAPSGATVVVDHEVSPLGRLGQPWLAPATSTLAFAVVLRPRLSAEEADVPWLVAALAVADGIEAADGRVARTVWPDQIVDEDGTLRAHVRADVQLGPGKVRLAVASVRMDVSADADPERRERLLTAICDQLDRRTAELAEGVAGPLAAYEKRCSIIGRNVKLRMLPRGEVRGHAAAVDPLGRLELRSATGMVERVSVNQIRGLEVLA